MFGAKHLSKLYLLMLFMIFWHFIALLDQIFPFFNVEICYLPYVFLTSQWAGGIKVFGVACSPTPEKQQIWFFLSVVLEVSFEQAMHSEQE